MRINKECNLLYKDEYLASNDVKDFTKFLSEHINDRPFEFNNNYLNIRKKKEWKCNTLANAFENYEWKVKDCFSDIATGESFESNNKVLLFLRSKLMDSIFNKSPEELKNAAIDVFKWGGTINGNKSFIDALYVSNTIIDYFKDAIDFFSKDYFDAHYFEILKLRSNAGFTKIYSLLLDHFVIYDSRVAAALTLLVISYCKKNCLKCVPVNLQFCVMPAKEDKKTLNHKCRNPSQNSYSFQMMNNNNLIHSRSNVMANWVIESALNNCGGFTHLGNSSDDFRALEASLFMIGYDLKNNALLHTN